MADLERCSRFPAAKARQFDLASQLLFELPVPELHTVPGEHDGVHFVDRQRHASLQDKGNITRAAPLHDSATADASRRSS